MEVKTYVTPLLKWWWLIVTATLLAAVSSYLAVDKQPFVYRASTTLMIGSTIDDPNPSGNELALGGQLANTYAVIARREPIRVKTMEALGLAWLPQYTVIPNAISPLLDIIVVDVDPVRAQAVANELANQLILQSPTALGPEEQERERFINEQLNELQVKIAETQDEIAAKQDELEDAVSARDIAELDSDIVGLQGKLLTLQANFAALLSNTQRGAVNTLTVIEPASLPQNPVGPNKRMTVITAAAIGFALAAGAAYLLEYLDDTVRTLQDLEQIPGLTALPSVPRFDLEPDQSRVISSEAPRSPMADAFRALRASIFSPAHGEPGRVILVSSPAPKDGKSIVAANLAVVMAQSGQRVLLVDSDLRRPVVHRLFELSGMRGLTDLLLVYSLANRLDDVEALFMDVIQSTQEPRLDVLARGPFSTKAIELLNSSIMSEIVSALAQRYDRIILDSPPVLAVSDAVVLSSEVDAVLLVARAGSVKRKQLEMTLNRYGEVDASVVGVTLNCLSPKADGYYAYYRDYYAGSEAPSEVDDLGTQNGRESEWLRKWVTSNTPDDANQQFRTS